jgi:hypothetical protein
LYSRTTPKYEGKLFYVFSSFIGCSMSSAAVLKGRPIELLPDISIWEYIETKVKTYSSKVAQVSSILRVIVCIGHEDIKLITKFHLYMSV